MVPVISQSNRHLVHILLLTPLIAIGDCTTMNYGELADIAKDWSCPDGSRHPGKHCNEPMLSGESSIADRCPTTNSLSTKINIITDSHFVQEPNVNSIIRWTIRTMTIECHRYEPCHWQTFTGASDKMIVSVHHFWVQGATFRLCKCQKKDPWRITNVSHI